MQNFNEQQLELIKNSSIVLARRERYNSHFQEFLTNGMLHYHLKFFDLPYDDFLFIYHQEKTLMVYDVKVYTEFDKIKESLIQKEEQERLASLPKIEPVIKPTLFEKAKHFFGI